MSGLVGKILNESKPVAASVGVCVAASFVLLLSVAGYIELSANAQALVAAVIVGSAAYGYYAYTTAPGRVLGGCGTCGGCPTCVTGGCMTCGGNKYGGGLGLKDLQKIPELISSTRALSADVKQMCAAASSTPALAENCQKISARLQTVDAVLAVLP